MGYTTDFNGSLNLSKNLTSEQQKFITKFSQTRRMKRDVTKLMELYKGKGGIPFTFKPNDEQQGLIELLENTGLKVTVKPTKDNRTPEEIYGVDGEYFVGAGGFAGQDNDASVIDNNTPPGQIGWDEDSSFDRYEKNQKRAEEGLCQPGLWCQWIINDDNELVWDGGEKFYSYVEWLKYLITNFFQPWGVLLNGEITWEGEESSDLGKIVVTDNMVTVLNGSVNYN